SPTSVIPDPPVHTRLSGTDDNATSGFAFATLPGTQPINGIPGSANTVYIVGDPGGAAFIGKLASKGGTPLSLDDLAKDDGMGHVKNLVSRQLLSGQISTPESITTRVDPTDSTWVDLFVQNRTGVYFAIDKSGASDKDFGTLTFSKIISASAEIS